MLKTFQSSYLISSCFFCCCSVLIEISTRECSFFDFDFLGEISSTGVVCQERMMCLHIYFQNFVPVLWDLTSAKGLPPSM